MNRLGRILLPPVATALVALAAPALASATDYCVQTSCGGATANTIEDALAMAEKSDQADRVILGEHVYVAQYATGFVYGGASPIEIIGAGRGRTTLTAPPGNGAVLTLQGADGSSVHDLTIKLPQHSQGNGLYTLNEARRIDVTEDEHQSHAREGVMLIWGGTLEDSDVRLTRDAESTAVAFGAGGGNLRRSTASAGTGVLSWHDDSLIEGSRVTGLDYGVRALSGLTTIRTSWVHLAGHYGTGIRADTYTHSTTVNADSVTVTGPYVPDVVGVGAVTSLSPTYNAEVNLTNSVVRIGGAPLFALAAGAGTSRVAASYSAYDPTYNATSGGVKASISEANVLSLGNEGFADPAGGDYHVLPTSVLVDSGDPAAAQGLDLDGNPLVADGNGDGMARRDIGAYELQPGPAGEAGGGGGGGPTPDTTAPLVRGFRATPAVFALGRAGTPASARVARGTRLRYALSEPARVTVAIKRAVKRDGRVRYRTVGSLKRNGTSGANTIRFTGRIGKRALRAGRYRAVIRATDAAGNRSAPRTIRLRITRR